MITFKEALSTLSRNGLARCFGEEILETPEKIAAAGSAWLTMTAQLGPKPCRKLQSCYMTMGILMILMSGLETKLNNKKGWGI